MPSVRANNNAVDSLLTGNVLLSRSNTRWIRQSVRSTLCSKDRQSVSRHSSHVFFDHCVHLAFVRCVTRAQSKTSRATNGPRWSARPVLQHYSHRVRVRVSNPSDGPRWIARPAGAKHGDASQSTARLTCSSRTGNSISRRRGVVQCRRHFRWTRRHRCIRPLLSRDERERDRLRRLVCMALGYRSSTHGRAGTCPRPYAPNIGHVDFHSHSWLTALLDEALYSLDRLV